MADQGGLARADWWYSNKIETLQLGNGPLLIDVEVDEIIESFMIIKEDGRKDLRKILMLLRLAVPFELKRRTIAILIALGYFTRSKGCVVGNISVCN